jgi:hypothetical protein
VQVPNIVYLGQIKKRKNTVDGWGTLKTPYGTFQALRVKSEVSEMDTAYLDTLQTTFPALNRKYTEYKWLVKGYGVPVLEITDEGPSISIIYIDSLRILNVNETSNNIIFNVYPNPVNDKLYISFNLYKSSQIVIELFNVLGEKIKELDNSYRFKGAYNDAYQIENDQLQKGIYLIKIITNTGVSVRKLVIRK